MALIRSTPQLVEYVELALQQTHVSRQVEPVSPDVDEQLHKWMDKTPAMAAIKGATADKAATAGDKEKKGGKGDKKTAAGGKKKKK